MAAFPDQRTEVLVYRRVLQWCAYIGLGLVLVTFVAYASGLVESYIPLPDLRDFWTQSVCDYVESAEIETGWGWLGMLRYAEFLNFVGIAFLASVSVICYVAIIPFLLRDRDTIYAVIAMIEIAVLAFAASGVLGVT